LFDIPKPDKNILLYMPTEIGQILVDKKWHRDYVWWEKRDIHEADLQHLKDAAEAYKYVAEKYDWTIIDSAPDNELQTIEVIAEKIWKEIQKMI
jgi:dTMP kinase